MQVQLYEIPPNFPYILGRAIGALESSGSDAELEVARDLANAYNQVLATARTVDTAEYGDSFGGGAG